LRGVLKKKTRGRPRAVPLRLEFTVAQPLPGMSNCIFLPPTDTVNIFRAASGYGSSRDGLSSNPNSIL